MAVPATRPYLDPSTALYSLNGVRIATSFYSSRSAWLWAREKIAARRNVPVESIDLREAEEGEPADVITIDGDPCGYLVDWPIRELFEAHFRSLT